MAIKSITDWNSRIVMCACCEMPDHPWPRTEFQHKDIIKGAAGWNFASFQSLFGQATGPDFVLPLPDSQIVYRSVTRSVTDTNPNSEPVTYTITTAADAELSWLGYPFPTEQSGTDPLQPYAGAPIQVTSYSTGSYTGTMEYEDGEDTYQSTVTLTFSDPVTFDALRAVTQAKMAGLDWLPSTSNDYWIVYALTMLASGEYYQNDEYVETGYPGYVRLIAIRYRLGIPFGYAGQYYKIECDEVFFPADPEVQSSLVAARVWEYSGADEFSAWFEIAPPETAGAIRIRNLRVTSYRSPWGTKPRYIGERWDPPPPPG